MSQNPPDPRQHKAIPWGIAAMPAYTVGMLAPVPFLYAAVRQQIHKLWLIAAAYGALWTALWVLVGITSEHSAANAVSGFLFFALAIAGTTHAFVLRELLPRRPCARCAAAGPQQLMPPAPTWAPSDPNQVMCAQVRTALGSLKAAVARHGELFPPVCKQLLDETVAPALEVVAYVARGGHTDAELRSVHAIATDYLPTSVNTYIRLPPEYVISQRNPDGRTAADELELQLQLLRESAKEAASSLYRSDAQRMVEQSAFLQAKFGKSDLDLP